MEIVLKFLEKNGLVVAFLVVGLMILVADSVSKRVLNKKVPTPAIAIVLGLLLAYVGGTISGGEKGIADLKLFAGMGHLGGSMFRDFAIVSTAFGASILLMRKSGIVGAISLIIVIVVAFSVGLSVAWGRCLYVYRWASDGSCHWSEFGSDCVEHRYGRRKSDSSSYCHSFTRQAYRLRQPAHSHGIWGDYGNQRGSDGWFGRNRPQISALWRTYCYFLHRSRMSIMSFYFLFID